MDRASPVPLVLGLCPTLAVTKTADNGLGMGLAVIFVLVLSNMLISLVRDIIPKKSPHRLLHRHFRVARGCRGTAHAGLRLPAVPAARHFRAAHRGELHHSGPGRSLRRQNTVPLAIADGLGMGWASPCP